MTDQIHIDYIKKAFQEMTTMEDFLVLLNYAKPLVYGEKTYAFEMKQITYYVKNRSTLNRPEPQNENSKTKLILKENVPPIVFVNKSNKVYGNKQTTVPDNRYTSFQIQKKSGKMRTIHAPVPGLKAIQTTLGFVLQCIFEPHKAAMGFVKGKSIVDNAGIHTGQNYVYNIDLKDFFPSIDQARVWKCLQLKPFNLTDKEIDEAEAIARIKSSDLKFVTDEGVTVHYEIKDGQYILVPNNFGYLRYLSGFIKQLPIPDFTEVTDEAELDQLKSNYRELIKSAMLEDAQNYILTEDHKKYLHRSLPLRRNIANTIAALCCTEMMVERKAENGEWESVRRNVLPQGAPTSPVITNIICQRLDYLLTAVANRFGLRYSRYADDITFSSMHNVYKADGEFLKELQRIILEQGFHIMESKTRLQKDGYRKEVTGLLVHEKANVQKRYIKQLRMWLYYWENYGYDRAYSFFLQQYMADKANIVKGKPSMVNVIGGKLDYLKMVKGDENELYLKLKRRFDTLTVVNKTLEKKITSISPENILSIIDFEISSDKVEEVHQQNTNRLRINIIPIASSKGQIRLKRQIIIRKGESLPHEELLENNEEEEKEIDLSKHRPLDVSKFLKYFQTGKLKWLTHKYEEGSYNRSKIIQEAKDEFISLTRSLVIQPALYRRVNWFGFVSNEENFYFLNKFHFTNWQSPNVLKWELENPNMHPINSDLLFIEMFGPFKKSIELKDKELKNLISNQLVSSLGGSYTSFDFEYNDLDNVNFYTDVDALKRGLSYLFNAIKQRSENSHNVKFQYRRVSDVEGRKRILEIIHIGSSCNKSLDKNELFKGDLLAAEKALFGICDWAIISKSPDDSVNKLNVLFDISSNKMPKEKIDESLIEGFTHVLTFYA